MFTLSQSMVSVQKLCLTQGVNLHFTLHSHSLTKPVVGGQPAFGEGLSHFSSLSLLIFPPLH